MAPEAKIERCYYCLGRDDLHQGSCPGSRELCVKMWESGYDDAMAGRLRAAEHSLDKYYLLGFVRGETRKVESLKEASSKHFPGKVS
jgi:hypothetical protein